MNSKKKSTYAGPDLAEPFLNRLIIVVQDLNYQKGGFLPGYLPNAAMYCFHFACFSGGHSGFGGK